MVRFLSVLAAVVAVLLPAAPAAAARDIAARDIAARDIAARDIAARDTADRAAGPSVAGGDVLTGSGRCTLGFNVTGRGILAGPCGPVGTRWSVGTTPVGRVTWVAPDGLTSLISISNPAVAQVSGLRLPGGGFGDIAAAGRVPVGSTVQAVSAPGGLRSGVLTGVNATVVFAGEVVTGLDRTSICSGTGEAGAPIFRGTTALGLVVGGSGSCATGGTTYGRPVVQLLAQTGRAIY